MIADQFRGESHKSIIDLFVGHLIEALVVIWRQLAPIKVGQITACPSSKSDK